MLTLNLLPGNFAGDYFHLCVNTRLVDCMKQCLCCLRSATVQLILLFLLAAGLTQSCGSITPWCHISTKTPHCDSWAYRSCSTHMRSVARRFTFSQTTVERYPSSSLPFTRQEEAGNSKWNCQSNMSASLRHAECVHQYCWIDSFANNEACEPIRSCQKAKQWNVVFLLKSNGALIRKRPKTVVHILSVVSNHLLMSLFICLFMAHRFLHNIYPPL